MDTTTLVPVCVGACLCPGTPHADGDFVYLRPKLGLAAGVELQQHVLSIRRSTQEHQRLIGQLIEAYVLVGVAEWNLIGPKGPIPVSRESLSEHLLTDFVRAKVVADAADGLYYEPVLAPLVNQALTSSSGTSSNGSTSATNGSTPKPRKRSKRSSTTTTRTASTAKTT